MSRLICLALLLSSTVAPIHAQQAAIQPQSRIRVQQAGQSGWTVGNVVRSSDDSLHIFTESGLVSVSRPEIARLDISRGRVSNVGGGLKRGAFIGGAIGLALGVAVLVEQSGEDSFIEYGPEIIPGAALGGALWGGFIGALVGAGKRTDVWEEVHTAPAAVTVLVAPASAGMQAGLSVNF